MIRAALSGGRLCVDEGSLLRSDPYRGSGGLAGRMSAPVRGFLELGRVCDSGDV
jgi:hypothetical protein